jgi:hypothetical protein
LQLFSAYQKNTTLCEFILDGLLQIAITRLSYLLERKEKPPQGKNIQFNLFLEPYAEYGLAFGKPKTRSESKSSRFRHKIDGLITRLFYAERLSFWR